MNLRLATCHSLAPFFHDDAPLVPALAAHGIEAIGRAWQEIDGSDPVAIRSVWDYTLDVPGFVAWLDRLERSAAPVMNGTDTIRCNIDKRYLRDIASKGHTIVPTEVLDVFDPATAMDLAHDAGWLDTWDAVIAKPVQGAGAEGLVVIDEDGPRGFDLSGNTWGTFETTPQGACLVQPLLPSIRDGEWSLIYLGGEFSHAVLKSPNGGDIRVQEEHGATSRLAVPPAPVRAAADAIMADQDVEYARVDGVDDPVLGFALMELEMIEPELFFRYHPPAVTRFAEVSRAWMRA